MLFRRSPEDRRLAALRRAPPGPLRDYLEVPFEDPGTDHRQAHYLAIDLELTGLDPRSDEILSVGMVPIDGRDIVLGGAAHLLISPTGEVGQSASIHRLTDDHLAGGMDLAVAMPLVLQALTGRTLVAHHAPIEVDFLSAACRRLYGRPLVTSTIDTMILQRRILRLRGTDQVQPGQLRLQSARDHFDLPRYRAHEALTDAIAAAELFLAQAAHLGSGAGVPLKSLRS